MGLLDNLKIGNSNKQESPQPEAPDQLPALPKRNPQAGIEAKENVAATAKPAASAASTVPDALPGIRKPSQIPDSLPSLKRPAATAAPAAQAVPKNEPAPAQPTVVQPAIQQPVTLTVQDKKEESRTIIPSEPARESVAPLSSQELSKIKTGTANTKPALSLHEHLAAATDFPQTPILQAAFSSPNNPSSASASSASHMTQASSSSDKSFFGDVESRIGGPEGLQRRSDYIKELISQDFIESMKRYHSDIDYDAELYIHKTRIGNEIAAKIKALKLLEQEWHAEQKELKMMEQKIISTEMLIDENSQELKMLIKAYAHDPRYSMTVSDDRAFYLHDGKILRSITEFSEALKVMPEDVFRYHVTAERNDFARWVIDIFRMRDLGNKMMKCRTRKEFLEILG